MLKVTYISIMKDKENDARVLNYKIINRITEI